MSYVSDTAPTWKPGSVFDVPFGISQADYAALVSKKNLELRQQWFADGGGSPRERMMYEAYNPGAYGFNGGARDADGNPITMTGKEAGQVGAYQVEESRKAKMDPISRALEEAGLGGLLGMLGLGGSGASGGDGGAAAAAALQATINKINEDYDRQLGALNMGKATATTDIGNSYGNVKGALAANDAVYQQSASSLNNAIVQRAADTTATLNNQNASLQNSADKLGWNGAAIQANNQNNLNTVGNANNFQQDLQNRYQQVAASGNKNWNDSAALVNQGAMGNLTNNYNSAVGGLEQSKSDALYAANNPTSGGGGGGGRSSSSGTSQIKDLISIMSLARSLNPQKTLSPEDYLKTMALDPENISSGAFNSSLQQFAPEGYGNTR
jgi:hypothetical protein